ncbi:MAG TPA: DMT family transporter [Paracoccaceae bacterium]|nr:DMT family transporter [Paracoccaceae bacterium]
MTATDSVADRRGALKGHAAMLLFAAAISVSFSLGDRAAELIAPEALNALRFGIGALVLGVIAALGPGLSRGQLAAPWRYPLLGGIFAVYFVLMFVALALAEPVSVGTVFTLTPAMAALFGWLLLRQRATPRMLLALAIGAAGAVWVIFRADLDALLDLRVGRGEAVFAVGCAAHALYTPLVRRLNRGEPPLAFSFWTTASVCLVLVAGSAATGSLFATDWAALPPIVWAAVLYLALGATALTVYLVQFATMRLPAAKVMAYGYLVPSFVTLWEALFGFGPPPAAVLAGVAATALAMLLLLAED